MKLDLRIDQLRELENIGDGVFQPLSGFMTKEEFESVVYQCKLHSSTFTIPVVLDVARDIVEQIEIGDDVSLDYGGKTIGRLRVKSIFDPNYLAAAKEVYGTTDENHPGVKKFLNLQKWCLGGDVEYLGSTHSHESSLSPIQSREYFKKMGWQTVCGFQTRNVPHRAHEMIQKLALRQCDGLMIQPLIGTKKPGDFTPEVVVSAYEVLIRNYFPANRVLLNVLTTSMRYAGPREAAFHALIRRNFGCTHFIVGRDHAGVGDYYEKYEAHQFLRKMDGLGIEVIYQRGPYFCIKCDEITSDSACPHGDNHPEFSKPISGTDIRARLRNPERKDDIEVDPQIVRPEVWKHLKEYRQDGIFCT